MYYCCLEAIQNATKHGGPLVHISLALWQDRDELCFEVSDDGRGFDPREVSCGAGLQNIHHRIRALDGAVQVRSAVGGGVVVSGSVPVAGVLSASV